MTSNRIRTAVLAACAALTIAGGVAHAHGDKTSGREAPSRMSRHYGHERLPLAGTLKQLELSAEQRQSVRSIFESNAGARRALHEQRRANRAALASTMPDDPGYPALIETRKSLAAQAIQQASDVETQIYALLTPEQKAKVPPILAERKARWEQRRGQRRERSEQQAS